MPTVAPDGIKSVVLVGAGKMGSAMLQSWIRIGVDPGRITVLEPHPGPEIVALASRGLTLNPAGVAPATIIVVAVKPQVAADVVPGLVPWIGPGTLLASIMAGRTLRGIERVLPRGTAVVRAMPNLPAAIGRGITVAVPNAAVTASQRAVVDRLLTAIGAVEWIAEETLLDAVTAVSGSGPAYVFLLAELLARAGTAAGLPAGLATRLARATIAGSGEMLAQSPLTAETLRHNVTSPGGTTAAALEVLMRDDRLGALLTRAVAAATRRAGELADEPSS
jgi:pyrroline-5-carboxylate reductase